MEKPNTLRQHLDDVQSMIRQGHNNDSIEKKLKQKGIEESLIVEILTEVKRIRNRKRTKTGSLLSLLGVVLLGIGFISCIVIHLNGGDVGFSLYGITAAGAVILIAGLVFIFS